MALNTTPLASTIAAAYTPFINTGPSLRQSFIDAWSDGYTAYANDGINPIAEIANDGAIIGDALSSFEGYDISNVTKLAQAITEFWSGSHLVPKGVAVTITGNNAASKIGAIESAILASRTDQLKTPPYKHLFDAIEPVIKTIIWTGITSTGATVYGTIS